MKQHTFNWLCYSIILLLLISCKKKTQRIFDDFPSGKFDGVWITELNGNKDTLSGEFSGPYPFSKNYSFRRRSILDEDKPGIGLYARSNGIDIDNITYYLYPNLIDAKITDFQLDKNKLFLSYNSGDTLTGTIHLTRK